MWAFDQPENMAVLTVRQVLLRQEPVLFVSHDAEDHGWQFLGAALLEEKDALTVPFKQMITLDPSLVELADLPVGHYARRTSQSAPWERGANHPD